MRGQRRGCRRTVRGCAYRHRQVQTRQAGGGELEDVTGVGVEHLLDDLDGCELPGSGASENPGFRVPVAADLSDGCSQRRARQRPSAGHGARSGVSVGDAVGDARRIRSSQSSARTPPRQSRPGADDGRRPDRHPCWRSRMRQCRSLSSHRCRSSRIGHPSGRTRKRNSRRSDDWRNSRAVTSDQNAHSSSKRCGNVDAQLVDQSPYRTLTQSRCQ